MKNNLLSNETAEGNRNAKYLNRSEREGAFFFLSDEETK